MDNSRSPPPPTLRQRLPRSSSSAIPTSNAGETVSLSVDDSRPNPTGKPRVPQLGRLVHLLVENEVMVGVLIAFFTVAQLGVSAALAFNVVDNRIMSSIAFVLSLGSVCLFGTLLFSSRALGMDITISNWSSFAAQVIVTVLKFAAMLYQFKLGESGENPLIADYSLIPVILSAIASRYERRNIGPN